jgi:hypothetical protein
MPSSLQYSQAELMGERTSMKGVLKNTFLFLISTALVTSSTLIPQEIKTLTAAKEVKHGLPLPFVKQQRYHIFNNAQGDYPRVPGTPNRPIKIQIESPWNAPSQIMGWIYFLNIVIIFSSFRLLDFLVLKTYEKVKFR